MEEVLAPVSMRTPRKSSSSRLKIFLIVSIMPFVSIVIVIPWIRAMDDREY